MIEVKFQLLNEDSQLPAYSRVGDAAMDLRCAEDFTLEPFERRLVPCGVAMELPDGYAGLVLPRSGLALKHGLSLVNAPGLIDANYRGEIKVPLINMDAHEPFSAKRGERVAQLLIVKAEEVLAVAAAQLSDSNRGVQGFGSSGR